MNYNKSKIYKIWSPKGDKIYIGSTIRNYLSQRMAYHRSGYTFYKKNNTKFITSFLLFDEYGIENCIIELIEEKELNNINELRQLEGHYIRTLSCVNKVIVGRTDKEYRVDNKDKIKQYHKNNKDKINKMRKLSYLINKEKIKDKIKDYYQNNKEKVKERRQTKFICECGSEICKGDKAKHIKTLKHKQLMETIDT